MVLVGRWTWWQLRPFRTALVERAGELAIGHTPASEQEVEVVATVTVQRMPLCHGRTAVARPGGSGGADEKAAQAAESPVTPDLGVGASRSS